MVVRVFLLVALFLLSANTFAKGFTAQVDRLSVGLGEHVQLVLMLEDVQGSEPDVSALENDFTILQQSQSSSVRIINGVRGQTIKWLFVLSPKRKGTLTIPSFSSGSYLSESIDIDVGDAPVNQSTTDKVLLEVEVTPLNPYVKGQVIYTQRLYFSEQLVNNASLDQPTLEKGDAEILFLGSTNPYRVKRNGQPYQLIERYYSVFPSKAGELVFNPSVFRGSIVDRQRQQQRGAFGMFNVGKKVSAYSSKASLNIAEQPVTYTGKYWLPSSQLDLAITWSQPPETLKAGEPVTITTAVMAEGLKAEVLPEIQFEWPASVKTYPEKPEFRTDKKSNGVLGLRQGKVVVVANENGEFTIPAVKIAWWNTKTNKQEVKTLDGFTLNVTGAAVTASAVPIEHLDVEKDVVNEEASEQVTMNEVDSSMIEALQAFYIKYQNKVLIAIVLLFALLGAAFFIVKRLSRPKTQNEIALEALSSAKQVVIQACVANNAKAVIDALPAWAVAVGISPATLAGIEASGDELLSHELRLLSQANYAPNTVAWSGDSLRRAIEAFGGNSRHVVRHKEGLGSLHPEY